MSRIALESSGAIRLAEARFVIDAITGALDTLEGITSNLLADALAFAEFTAHEVAKACGQVLGLADVATALPLEGIYYDIDLVLQRLDYVGKVSDQAMTNALKYAGYGIHQITSALNSALGLGDQAIASLLKGVGYTLDQVAGAIDRFFSLSDEALAEVLGAWGST